MSDPYAATGGTSPDSAGTAALLTAGATTGASKGAEPGWYDLASDYVSQKVSDAEEEVLLDYSRSDTSAAVDVALPKVQAHVDDLTSTMKGAEDGVKKYLGYFEDPEKFQQTLDSVKWILIAGGLIYLLWTVGPIVGRLARAK